MPQISPFLRRPLVAFLTMVAAVAAPVPALAQGEADPATEGAELTLEQVETAYRSGDLATARAGLVAHAEAGSALAQYRLGFMMAHGEGGPPDREGAIRWLEAAVAQDHGPAAMLLARVYLGGNPEEPHYVRAAELLSDVAETGDLEAKFMLGQLYRVGRGVEGDKAQAAALIEEAARGDLLAAQFTLAQMYSRGEGVEKDVAQAARWLFQAAEAGHGPAQMSLYQNYAEGLGFPKDEARALEWLKAAAEGGYVEGEHTLGSNYLLGEGGMEADPVRGVSYLMRAAEKGHPGAQSNLGYAYYTGTGVPKDLERAFHWYKLAADQGLARAALVVGSLYEKGLGTEPDVDQAILYYRFADSRGSRIAAQALGQMIADGRLPVDEHPEAGPSWAAQAADAGSEEALEWLEARAQGEDGLLAHYLLGALYYKSEAVPQNPAEAVRHMRIAAEADVVPAQEHMGLFHAEGYGVDQDLVKAHVWMNIAASNGSDSAAEKRDSYAALLTPEQIAEAQERARGRLRGTSK